MLAFRCWEGFKVTYMLIIAAGLIWLIAACSPSEVASPTYIVTTLVDANGQPHSFKTPEGLAVDANGNLYIAESLGGVQRISPQGEASMLLGGDELALPAKVDLDAKGTLYIVESAGNRIIGLGVDGAMSVIAGSGESGDQDGSSNEAQFSLPIGIAVDENGTVYVADSGNGRIRRISPDGQVDTIAGGQPNSANDNDPDTRFIGLTGLALDGEGDLYVAEAMGGRIRVIHPDGKISTVAGAGDEGFADGNALEALFNRPADVAVDQTGNIYVADLMNHSIRLITPDRRVITIAGTGEEGYVDGVGSEARFRYPQAVAVGPDGTIYVADSGNGYVRIIRQSDAQ